MMRDTNRLAALQAGESVYVGKPCRHGHTPARRYTQSAACCQCQLDAKRAQRARERAMRPA